MSRLMSKIKKNYLNELPLIKLYALLYIIGVFIGVIGAVLLQELFKTQTKQIFLSGMNSSLWSLFIYQLLSFLVLYSLGLTVIGVPLLPFYPLYKGFSIGILLSMAIIISGVQGLAFGTLAFFSQNILYSVLGYFICYSSARLSLSLMDLLKGRGKHGAAYREFLFHTYRFLICIPLILLISFWQWKVVPVILKLF